MERLCTSDTTLDGTLRIAYPAGGGRVALRTEQDWERDLERVAVTEDRLPGM